MSNSHLLPSPFSHVILWLQPKSQFQLTLRANTMGPSINKGLCLTISQIIWWDQCSSTDQLTCMQNQPKIGAGAPYSDPTKIYEAVWKCFLENCFFVFKKLFSKTVSENSFCYLFLVVFTMFSNVFHRITENN